jgi:hypothetical protein
MQVRTLKASRPNIADVNFFSLSNRHRHGSKRSERVASLGDKLFVTYLSAGAEIKLAVLSTREIGVETPGRSDESQIITRHSTLRHTLR